MVWLVLLNIISISVYPRVSMSGDVRVTIHIERSVDNREYSFSWQCNGEPIGSSSKTMDGDNEPTQIIRYLQHLPDGECSVEAAVLRAGKIYKTSQTFIRGAP